MSKYVHDFWVHRLLRFEWTGIDDEGIRMGLTLILLITIGTFIIGAIIYATRT